MLVNERNYEQPSSTITVVEDFLSQNARKKNDRKMLEIFFFWNGKERMQLKIKRSKRQVVVERFICSMRRIKQKEKEKRQRTYKIDVGQENKRESKQNNVSYLF